MTNATFTLPRESAGANFRAEALSILLGAGATAALFLGVAHFDSTAPAAVDPDLTELHVMSLPPETPPPRPVETPPTPVAALPFAGLEVGASDSPVRIAVVPPDLSALMPVDTIAPSAKIEPAKLYSEFKPRTEIDSDFGRIFQPEEVDQRPTALVRPKPNIPGIVRGTAKKLSILVLVLIDTHGAVTNIRVLQPSGNKHFDEIILRDIRTAWVFSPAVKRGHKVRCLLQQNVRVEWTNASPFESQ